jgi:hypothetical protein
LGGEGYFVGGRRCQNTVGENDISNLLKIEQNKNKQCILLTYEKRGENR